jgi:hypothetical protein
VWKDVLFANLAVFACALLFAASRIESRSRYLLYLLSLLIAACGGLVRQNGAIVLLVIGVGIAFIEKQGKPARNRALAVVYGSIVASLVFGCVMLGTNLLIKATANGIRGDAFDMSQVVVMRYDIIGILARGKGIDPRLFESRGLDATAVVEDARRHYSAERHEPFWNINRPSYGLRRLASSEVKDIWSKLVVTDPKSYLGHRVAVFRWMIWPPDLLKCLPVHVGVDGSPETLLRLQIQPGVRSSDVALYRYATHFFVAPLYRHGVFFAAALILLVISLALFGLTGAAPVVTTLTAGLLFSLSWAVFAVACDFRYMYFLFTAVFASLVMLSIMAAERRRPIERTLKQKA